jgi:hypothetical protein
MNEKTFENVTRVTPNYKGNWMGAGWYAYIIANVTNNVFGRESYAEHVAIEYLNIQDEMTEEYVDFIGDYGFCVAETESNSTNVLSLFFSDDYDLIEDALTVEYFRGMRVTDPDISENDAREWVRLGMVEIDEYGRCGRNRIYCEYYEAHFLEEV